MAAIWSFLQKSAKNISIGGKDHKKIEFGEEEKGQKTRPICGAKDCITRRTSFLLSKLLTELIPPDETHCDSTENLIEEINKVNQEEVNKNWVVCSLDVDALYPSLDIQECCRVIEEKLCNSNFIIEGLQWTEIALYLRYQLNDDEITEYRLNNYCPTRFTEVGRPPIFVRSGSEIDFEKRMGPWVFKNIHPNDEEKKRMFSIAIRIMICTAMKLHDYVFAGKIIRQKGGGSIGLDLTGVISDIYMCHWDKILISILQEQNIEIKLYKRYKDDINIILNNTHDEMLGKQELEDATIKFIKQKSDSIHKSIIVTGDIPSNYEDNRLPILDLKVWIGEMKPGVFKVITSHYMSHT